MKHSHPEISKPSKLVVETVRFLANLLSKTLWRVKYYNLENIPFESENGLIIVSNHQTYFDPFWICIPIKRNLRFMTWDEPFKWFFIGELLRKLGCFPVSLKRGGGIKSLKEAFIVLEDGATLVIFPEGEREFADGDLLKFKTGAVRLALKVNVPILPITIRGGNKIWAREHKFPRLGKVEIFYHPIINFSDKSADKSADKHTNEHIEKLSEQLKKIISSN
ncbi:MAG: 1-acyl-sn-glycerol-3-phosphate acyltransferase [Acidobacteriota bacterium]|nr:1-acyl-sn-glycerol-3-phosphate acyltransferase [Acidobacteriota bacterium]